jgi:O-methyltransferase
MVLFDGRVLPGWMRHAVKRVAGAPGMAQHSQLLARFHWQARLAETRREFRDAPVFPSREDLYAYVNRVFFDGGRVTMDFLEFGVFEGDSLKTWSSLNHNLETRYWGFDSFEGLPEHWHAGKEKGTFSTFGKVPTIDDSRVQFVTGWFQDTLPSFLASFKPRSQLVVHNDSDLYSSTLYCLTIMHSFLRSGTIVIFDDFYDSMHQYRALTDYCSAYLRSFRIIGMTKRIAQAAVEIN